VLRHLMDTIIRRHVTSNLKHDKDVLCARSVISPCLSRTGVSSNRHFQRELSRGSEPSVGGRLRINSSAGDVSALLT
jgi:hypothetical protein